MRHTNNYGLNMPEGTDLYNVEDFNHNAEMIDEALALASQNVQNHITDNTNPHSVTKAQVGLDNVENKSSETIRSELTSSNVTTALGYTPMVIDGSNAASEVTFDGVAFTVGSRDDNEAVGVPSVVEGDGCAASIYAHAEGQYSKATGQGSHAESGGTIASGDWSHSEGYSSVASGSYSHAEGYSQATGDYAHSEGDGSCANAESSHAEGYITITNSNCSHAEGWGSSVIEEADAAHAEGRETIAKGYYCHAEGYQTEAGLPIDGINTWIAAHSEGYLTKASGNYSHAEGESTTASGKATHTEGFLTEASKIAAHAEGSWTKASGYYSHAEGQCTEAKAQGSHAEGHGYSTDATIKASQWGAHAEGYINNVGYSIEASGQGSHAEGCAINGNLIASGNGSHAEGVNTTAGGYVSHAEGLGSVANGASSHAGGRYGTTSRQNQFVHGGGRNKFNNAFQNNGAAAIGFQPDVTLYSADTTITNGTCGCGGSISGTAIVTIALEPVGMYTLYCSSYDSNGDVYGATVGMITATGNTNAPTWLELNQTVQASAQIDMISNNQISIQNTQTFTQFHLIRVM